MSTYSKLDLKIRDLIETNGEKNEEFLLVHKKPIGRLGNLLFQYASTSGIANHNVRFAFFDKSMLTLKNIFPRITVNVVPIDISWTVVKERTLWDFDKRFFHLPKKNVTIKGCLQSFRYFEDISKSLLKNIFSYFHPKLLSKANNFIKAVKNLYKKEHEGVTPKSVCVHIRRGDKAESIARKQSAYRLPSPNDILMAMHYMEFTFNNVVFIVTSDSKEWISEKIHAFNVYLSNMTSFEEDFVLMSSCDHIIMTVGTYGWFSSYLTSKRGGMVMYYKYPYIIGSRVDLGMNRSNSFPATWIPYDATEEQV